MNIVCFIAGHQYRYRINPDREVLGGCWRVCAICGNVQMIHPTRPLSAIPAMLATFLPPPAEGYPSSFVEHLATAYLADELKRLADETDDRILYGTRHVTLTAGFDESYPTDFFHPYPEQKIKLVGHLPDCVVNNQASMAGSSCYCQGVS